MKQQIDHLRRGTDIVVATPGRLMELSAVLVIFVIALQLRQTKQALSR